MAETTKEKLRARAATGSDLRDIAGAWLVCALIAATAPAVSVDLHVPGASAPFAIAPTEPSR
jgi:hypothetical protein